MRDNELELIVSGWGDVGDEGEGDGDALADAGGDGGDGHQAGVRRCDGQAGRGGVAARITANIGPRSDGTGSVAQTEGAFIAPLGGVDNEERELQVGLGASSGVVAPTIREWDDDDGLGDDDLLEG